MSARQFNYYDNWKSEMLSCPKCGWSGTFEEGSVELHNELMDSSCPRCDWPESPILAIVSYPTLDEMEVNLDRLSDEEKASLARLQWARRTGSSQKNQKPTAGQEEPRTSVG